jgi:hypothetical protein
MHFASLPPVILAVNGPTPFLQNPRRANGITSAPAASKQKTFFLRRKKV